jgi:hypothetical protein
VPAFALRRGALALVLALGLAAAPAAARAETHCRGII